MTAKFNKKSDLMLMRRAREYSSSCSQMVLVYLHPFCCNSLSCCQKLSKNQQKPYFGGRKSFENIDVDTTKNTSPAFVMINSTSVPICNCFHTRQGNSKKNWAKTWCTETGTIQIIIPKAAFTTRNTTATRNVNKLT